MLELVTNNASGIPFNFPTYRDRESTPGQGRFVATVACLGTGNASALGRTHGARRLFGMVDADASFTTEPFDGVRFGNRLVSELPGDRSMDRSVRAVHKACYYSILPVRVRDPQLVAYAPEVADLLSLRHELVESTPRNAATTAP